MKSKDKRERKELKLSVVETAPVPFAPIGKDLAIVSIEQLEEATERHKKELVQVRKDTLEAVEKELKENTPEQCGCDCHDLIPGGSCSVCHLNHKVLSLISGMKGGKE